MAPNTEHSQQASGSSWLHPADRTTPTPADNLGTAANTHTLRMGVLGDSVDKAHDSVTCICTTGHVPLIFCHDKKNLLLWKTAELFDKKIFYIAVGVKPQGWERTD